MENPNNPEYRYSERSSAEFLHRNDDQVLVSSASTLERTIGRPSSTWSEHDLAHAFVALDLRQVSLMHVAGDGKIKTLDFVPRDHNHFLQIVRYGERADGSSLFPGSGISAGASDIVLHPVISTAFVDPFSDEGTLAILCSHATRTGEPLPQSPISIVTRAYKRLLATAGFELHALGEVEYFLGIKLEVNSERADDRGYHAASPYVAGQELRRRALTLLAQIGVPVKYAHSEVGFAAAGSDSDVTWEQHEIELALAPLPDAANNVALTHWVLRNLARDFGMEISFDPVVRRGHAGSGMHFHLAPVIDDQFLAVYAKDGQVSDSAKLLIVGLLAHGCSLMAFGNRTPTSFVRLFQGKESPTSVTWGQFNRKALVRLPVTTKDAAGTSVYPETVEFRLPDGSANPYLLLAGIAQAAVDAHGREDQESILESMHCDAPPSKNGQQIPTSSDAIAHLLESERAVFEVDGVFPSGLIDTEIVKLREETGI